MLLKLKRLRRLQGRHAELEHCYQNAPADDCAILLIDRGERIVRYRRAIYAIIGFYFARVPDNGRNRELFFILRPLNGSRSRQSRNGVAVLVSSNGASSAGEDE